LKNNKVAQAYIFCGARGLGKLTLAKQFASAIICQHNPKEALIAGKKPCGVCHSCQALKKGIYPDMFLVERATDEKTDKLKRDVSVEQIRDLRLQLQQSSFLGSYKIAIIPEAERVNVNAANALLKTVEEPTAKTVIIFITDDIKKIPTTIVSRCQVIKFLPVEKKKISAYLIYKGLGLDKADYLAHLSHGRPGVAIDYWHEPHKLEKYLAHIDSFFEVLALPVGERLSWSEKEVKNFDEENVVGAMELMLENWQVALRDLMLLLGDSEQLVVNSQYLGVLEKQVGNFSFIKIKGIMEYIEQARGWLRNSINPRTILDNLIINL